MTGTPTNDVCHRDLAVVGAGPGLGPSIAQPRAAVHHRRLVRPAGGDDGQRGPGAGLRNYALTLHQALAADGIYAAHVALDLLIQSGGGEADPDALASSMSAATSRKSRSATTSSRRSPT